MSPSLPPHPPPPTHPKTAPSCAADKLSVEVFQDPAVAAGSPPGSSTPQQLAEAAVLKLVNPAAQNAGDGKLDMPPASKIKTEEREVDGRVSRTRGVGR